MPKGAEAPVVKLRRIDAPNEPEPAERQLVQNERRRAFRGGDVQQ